MSGQIDTDNSDDETFENFDFTYYFLSLRDISVRRSSNFSQIAYTRYWFFHRILIVFLSCFFITRFICKFVIIFYDRKLQYQLSRFIEPKIDIKTGYRRKTSKPETRIIFKYCIELSERVNEIFQCNIVVHRN
jgi:hypothetical protein